MSYETLLTDYTRETGVAVITLNQPETSNALTSEMMDELCDAVDRFEGLNGPEELARCIILTGSKKVFSSGIDVNAFAGKRFPCTYQDDLMGRVWRRLEATRVPIIAAVSGYVLGGGMELALMCDMVLSADSAKFGQPQIRRGTMPALGGTQRLARFIGKAKAMDLCLSGRMMTAEEAERTGLVSRIVSGESLLDDAKELAVVIAEMPRTAAMAIKESVNAAYETPMSQGLIQEKRLFQSLFATDDQIEGITAHLESRTPHFRGR